MPDDQKQKQLQMVWPESRLKSPPEVTMPAGYALRTFQTGDAPQYFKLMDSAGFKNWDNETLKPWLAKALPKGFFIMTESASGEIVATAMATHNPTDLHPFGGELGWLAASSEHAGKGLGLAVCAAVTRCFIQAGYRRIYLRTDDRRLAAIKVYLKLGYTPFLFAPDMKERWRRVCEKLKWPFIPDDWSVGSLSGLIGEGFITINH